MNSEDNEERRKCERMLEKVLNGMVNRLVPYMKVNVKVKMLGRDDFKIRMSTQTTLHQYGDIGIEPNLDEMYDYMDISINKTLLTNPDIGGVVSKLIDEIEIKLDSKRLNG